MKKLIFLITIIFFLFSIFNKFVYAIDNKIILKVEDEIITNYDLKNKIISTLILSNQQINQENINKLKKQSLELLIQYKLKKVATSNFNYEVSFNQLNKYLNNLSSENQEILKKKFKENNLDFQWFVDEVKTEFKWQRYIYELYAKKIIIDESLVDKEIEKNINNDFGSEDFKLSKIEILLKNDESDELLISEVNDYLSKFGFKETKEKFGNLNSIDDNLEMDWIKKDALSEKFYNIVSNLKIGQTTKAIKFQNTAIVLKLLDKRNTKINTDNLEKLRNNIINQKKNELFKLYSNSHLSKLRNSRYIQVK